MGLLRYPSIQEQNANTLAGVQVDTAVYVGTGSASAGMPVLRYGREAPVYILEGTQTAASVKVCMDNINATHGATMKVIVGTGAVTTSIVSIVTGSQAGPTIRTISSGVGQEATVVFDGVAKVWR